MSILLPHQYIRVSAEQNPFAEIANDWVPTVWSRGSTAINNEKTENEKQDESNLIHRAFAGRGVLFDLRWLDQRALQDFLRNVQKISRVYLSQASPIDDARNQFKMLLSFEQILFLNIKGILSPNNAFRLAVLVKTSAELVSLAKEINSQTSSGVGSHFYFLMQAESAKSLVQILEDPKCQGILNQIEHSFLPDISDAGLRALPPLQWKRVVQSFNLKRDYQFPLSISLEAYPNIISQVLKEINFDLGVADQNFSLSVIIPTNRSFECFKDHLKSIIDSAQRAQERTQSLMQIIIVYNNYAVGEEEALRLQDLFRLSNVHLTIVQMRIDLPHYYGSAIRSNLFLAGQARNQGVRWARASKILFIDSDISVEKELITETIEALRNCDVAQARRFYGSQRRLPEESYWRPFYESERWSDLKDYWKYTCSYTMGISRELFLRAGGFQDHFTSYGFEDVDLGYRISQLTKNFHLLKSEVLHEDLKPASFRFIVKTENSALVTKACDFRLRLKRFDQLSKPASLFFLDHLQISIGIFARNFLRWIWIKSVLLCNVLNQDNDRDL